MKKDSPRVPTYVFLDNLNVHHNGEVKAYAKQEGLELIFNASYYSMVNPIERLWNYSKRAFSKKIVQEPDWKSSEKVSELVKECVKGVDPATLKLHAKTCLETMKTDWRNLK